LAKETKQAQKEQREKEKLERKKAKMSDAEEKKKKRGDRQNKSENNASKTQKKSTEDTRKVDSEVGPIVRNDHFDVHENVNNKSVTGQHRRESVSSDVERAHEDVTLHQPEDTHDNIEVSIKKTSQKNDVSESSNDHVHVNGSSYLHITE
jgi:hypothetical protein